MKVFILVQNGRKKNIRGFRLEVKRESEGFKMDDNQGSESGWVGG